MVEGLVVLVEGLVVLVEGLVALAKALLVSAGAAAAAGECTSCISRCISVCRRSRRLVDALSPSRHGSSRGVYRCSRASVNIAAAVHWQDVR